VLSLLVNANIDDFLSSQAFVVNLRLLLANLTVVDVSRVIIAAVQQADGQVNFTASDVVNSLSDVSGLRRAADVSRGNLDAPGPAARVLAPRLLDVSSLAYTNTSCGVGKLCVAVEVRAFMAGMSDAIEADLTRIRLILESTMRLPAAFAPLASFAPTAWNLTDPATFVTIVPSSIVVVGTTRSSSSPGASGGIITVLGDTAVVGIVVAGALIILALVMIIVILRRRRRERAKIAPVKTKATAEARTPRPSLEHSPRAPEPAASSSADAESNRAARWGFLPRRTPGGRNAASVSPSRRRWGFDPSPAASAPLVRAMSYHAATRPVGEQSQEGPVVEIAGRHATGNTDESDASVQNLMSPRRHLKSHTAAWAGADTVTRATPRSSNDRPATASSVDTSGPGSPHASSAVPVVALQRQDSRQSQSVVTNRGAATLWERVLKNASSPDGAQQPTVVSPPRNSRVIPLPRDSSELGRISSRASMLSDGGSTTAPSSRVRGVFDAPAVLGLVENAQSADAADAADVARQIAAEAHHDVDGNFVERVWDSLASHAAMPNSVMSPRVRRLASFKRPGGVGGLTSRPPSFTSSGTSAAKDPAGAFPRPVRAPSFGSAVPATVRPALSELVPGRGSSSIGGLSATLWEPRASPDAAPIQGRSAIVPPLQNSRLIFTRMRNGAAEPHDRNVAAAAAARWLQSPRSPGRTHVHPTGDAPSMALDVRTAAAGGTHNVAHLPSIDEGGIRSYGLPVTPAVLHLPGQIRSQKAVPHHDMADTSARATGRPFNSGSPRLLAHPVHPDASLRGVPLHSEQWASRVSPPAHSVAEAIARHQVVHIDPRGTDAAVASMASGRLATWRLPSWRKPPSPDAGI
jgi:hypothetical protein